MSTPKRLLFFSILVPVTYHSYPTQIQRQQLQYDARTYNGGTINTDRCYFFLLLAAVAVRWFAHDRLVRARVVLWCTTSDLASMKHFAIVSLWIYCSRGVFFCLYSVFFRHVFLQPEPTLDSYVWKKHKRQHVWYVRVVRVHIHIYTLLYVYIMTQLHYNSSAVACIGGTRVDIQYTTAVRVHVPGTYIYIYIFIVHCNNNQ